MNDQNQKVQPDYGFILNQKVPEAPNPKKADKKLLIIIILLVTLAVLCGVTLIFSKTKSSVQTNSSTAKPTNQPVDPVNDFVELIKKRDYAAAGKQLAAVNPLEDNSESHTQKLRTLFSGYDANSCQTISQQQPRSVAFITLACTAIDKKQVAKITFDVTVVNGKYTIIRYEAKYEKT